jgi:hypothetical protein
VRLELTRLKPMGSQPIMSTNSIIRAKLLHTLSISKVNLAERAGFEPAIRLFTVWPLSRGLVLTTHPPLLKTISHLVWHEIQNGGGAEIRTRVTVRSEAFKTPAFDRSATPP